MSSNVIVVCIFFLSDVGKVSSTSIFDSELFCSDDVAFVFCIKYEIVNVQNSIIIFINKNVIKLIFLFYLVDMWRYKFHQSTWVLKNIFHRFFIQKKPLVKFDFPKSLSKAECGDRNALY